MLNSNDFYMRLKSPSILLFLKSDYRHQPIGRSPNNKRLIPHLLMHITVSRTILPCRNASVNSDICNGKNKTYLLTSACYVRKKVLIQMAVNKIYQNYISQKRRRLVDLRRDWVQSVAEVRAVA